MREVLIDIAKRLGEIPALSGELVKRRSEVSDILRKNLDSMKDREVQLAGAVAAEKNSDGKPAYPNEQARQAEIARRLQADTGYQFTRGEVERLRQELRELDARIEETGRRHRSDSNMAYLVASLLGAGLKEDAEAVLKAYAEGGVEATPEPVKQEVPKAEPKQSNLEAGVFTILEVHHGKSHGSIWARAEGPEGKATLYARNDNAKTLAAAVGRKVEVKYRRLDNDILYIDQVRPVA